MCRRIFLLIGVVICLCAILFAAWVSEGATGVAERQVQSAVSTSKEVVIVNDTAALDDGGFEAGTPSAVWSEDSLKYGTAICSTEVCGDHGRSDAHFAWFGGIRNEREIAVLSQQIQIDETASQLRGWLKITEEAGQGRLRIAIDGETVGEWNHDDVAQHAQYAEFGIDLSEYADGEMHTLAMDVHTEGVGLINFFVDDLSLEASEPTAVQIGAMEAATAPMWWLVVVGVMVALSIYVDVTYG